MKMRHLKAHLRERGFRVRPGKGSHSIWTHPNGQKVVLHGSKNADVHPYQLARAMKGRRRHRSAQPLPPKAQRHTSHHRSSAHS